MSFTKKNVTIINRKNTYIDKTVRFGNNVVIYEGNRIEGLSYIGDNTILLPNNYIVNSIVGKNSKIHSSVIADSEIRDNVIIGPFARIRPNSLIHNNTKIGNFCEIKNSTIGENTKISHLSYVGDAQIGNDTNIGCGVVFCNYNGISKSETIVGNNCFIGSNVNLIAPLKVDDGAYICAGTTIVKDCKENSLVIGRVRAEEKENRAQKYRRSNES